VPPSVKNAALFFLDPLYQQLLSTNDATVQGFHASYFPRGKLHLSSAQPNDDVRSVCLGSFCLCTSAVHNQNDDVQSVCLGSFWLCTSAVHNPTTMCDQFVWGRFGYAPQRRTTKTTMFDQFRGHFHSHCVHKKAATVVRNNTE
jgi:hypothetical protein